MGVLDRIHLPQGEERFWGFQSHWFERCIFNRHVFNSCAKIWQYFPMDSILLVKSVQWPSKEIFMFEIKVGVYKKFAEMFVILHKNHAKQQPFTVGEVNIVMATIVSLPGAHLFCTVWTSLASIAWVVFWAFITYHMEIW